MNRSAPTAAAAAAHLVVGGVGPAEPDVVGDGPVEHEVLLGDHHDVAAQLALRQVAQVDAVQRHRPRRRVVEPGDQLGDRRLARAGGADQRDGLPGRDRRGRDPGSTGRSGDIRELHVVEARRRRAPSSASTGSRRILDAPAARRARPASFSSADDADWKVLKNCEISCIGSKNIRRYSRNAASVPIVIWPCSTR